ncbi:MAG: sodium:solute symporter family protein [Acidobacteriota bacterium]
MSTPLWILLLYSLLLALLGILTSSRVKRPSDYFVAGRTLGPGLLFATLLAANIGAGSTVGAAGLGYQHGFSAWWWVGSAGLGSILLGLTVGPKIWAIAAAHGFFTVGDYLEFRYNRQVRLVTSILLWLGSLAILAGQLIALAWILAVVAGTPKWASCLLGGLLVTLYFGLGGLPSAARVNLVQLVVKLTGFVLAVALALGSLGGWQSFQLALRANLPPSVDPAAYFLWTGAGPSTVLAYVLLLGPSFVVSPGLLQKVYGARNPPTVRIGVLFNAFVLLLFAALPVLLGMIARLHHPDLANPELALPSLMVNDLPYWIGVLALASVFSAEVSSADAVLAMVTASVVNDGLRIYLGLHWTEAKVLQTSRLTAVCAGCLSVLLAIWLPTVVSALQIFYSLLTTALFVPLVAGLYWKRPDSAAAMASVALSLPTTLLVHWLTEGRGAGWLPPVGWGVLVGTLALILRVMTSHGRGE